MGKFVSIARKHVVTVRLSEGEKARFDKLIERMKKPASRIIRDWIDFSFFSPKEEGKP